MMRLRVVLEPSDEGGFTALVPALRGCISEGDTRDVALASEYGWKKHNFEIKKIVDGEEKESISLEIDHVNHVKRFKTGTFARKNGICNESALSKYYSPTS